MGSKLHVSGLLSEESLLLFVAASLSGLYIFNFFWVVVIKVEKYYSNRYITEELQYGSSQNFTVVLLSDPEFCASSQVAAAEERCKAQLEEGRKEGRRFVLGKGVFFLGFI